MITGIHHVTAIASDPQLNLDFYAGVLGLRLVKKTVNFDDPGTYHLYYGDGLGRPGTILTFFPYGPGSPGRVGIGQVTETALGVPKGSLDYWRERLAVRGIEFTEAGADALRLADPDGLRLTLEEGEYPGDGSGSGTVPPEFAIRGITGVVLTVRDVKPTIHLLTEIMGFTPQNENGQVFEAKPGASFARVAVIDLPEELAANPRARGLNGVGTVHHVAFRVPNDAAQEEWLAKLQTQGFHVSPVMDRFYFHSIYYREPGGILFELATDPPGFAADEPAEKLGEGLKLPEQYEKFRSELEAHLPPLKMPQE